ncbi:hypothetical protein DsansV1_C13g0127421 [Dioscorea sansibarensis]
MAAILSVRTAIASAGVVSSAVLLRFAGPSIISFLSAEVPRVYSSLLSWLTPPYLYFVINCIIISIAASSRFHMAATPAEPHPAPQAPQHDFTQPEKFAEVKAVEVEEPPIVDALPEYGKAELVVYGEEVGNKAEKEEDEFVISRSSWTPKRRVSQEIPSGYSTASEKPLVSSRFSHHRKAVKASPEGKALGVARSKRNETLESTWRTITDGRPVPLARHLKKFDTWDVHGNARENNTIAVAVAAAEAAAPPVRKAETFNERRQQQQQQQQLQTSAGRLRREPSLGQDDLNRRVEAFIKKFNEEMRLQRQESFQHYMDMINRGSH